MKKGSIVFLQAVVVLIGLGVLTFMLWEPHVEGRNVHSTVFQIYFHDPFLAYAYAASSLFFTALYQAFKLLGYIGRNEVFSQRSVHSLKIIKYCAAGLIVFILGAEAYIFVAIRGTDDTAGGVMMGVILMFVSAIIGTAAAVFEKLLQSAVDLKTENDLTV